MADEASLVAGLQPPSRAVLEGYFTWMKQKREKFLTDVQFESNSFAEGRLLEPTYNRAEVQAMFSEYSTVLRASVQKQENFLAVASAELFRNVLLSADRYGAPMDFASAEILNSQKVVAVTQQIEAKSAVPSKGRLQPLSASDKGDEAGKQLIAAQQEIRNLSEKLRKVTEQYQAVMKDRTQMNEKLYNMKDELASAESATYLQQQMKDKTVAVSEQNIAQLRVTVAQLQADINARLSQSSQFQSLKQMLLDRNEQVRKLRAALMKYDPAAAGQGDDGGILIADDDE